MKIWIFVNVMSWSLPNVILRYFRWFSGQCQRWLCCDQSGVGVDGFSLPAVDRIFRLRLKICSRVAFTRLYSVEWYSAVNLRYFSWMIT